MPDPIFPLDDLRTFQRVSLIPCADEGGSQTLEVRGGRGHEPDVRWAPAPWRSNGLIFNPFPSIIIKGNLLWQAWRTFLRICRPTDQVFYEVLTDSQEAVWVYRFVIQRGEKIRRFLLAVARHNLITEGYEEEGYPPPAWGEPLSALAVERLKIEWRGIFFPTCSAASAEEAAIIVAGCVIPFRSWGPREPVFRAAGWNMRMPQDLLRPGDSLGVIRQGVRDSQGTLVYMDYLQIQRGPEPHILTVPVGYHAG